jgi:hypothetical protein
VGLVGGGGVWLDIRFVICKEQVLVAQRLVVGIWLVGTIELLRGYAVFDWVVQQDVCCTSSLGLVASSCVVH